MLREAVDGAQVRFGPDAAADAFRGLYVTAEDAGRALARPVGEPLRTDAAPAPGWDHIAAVHPGWARLRRTANLSDAELDVVLVALAPEVDLRYERLYGYLQDDVAKRRATVDLALDLITSTAGERLAARRLFAASAPLRAGRVLRLVADPRSVAPPLPAHLTVVEDEIVAAVLEPDDLEAVPGPSCRWETAGGWATPADADPGPLRALAAAAVAGRALRLYFRGPRGAGKLRTAVAVAAAVGAPVLVVDAPRLPSDPDAAAEVLAAAVRIARRRSAVLVVEDADELGAGGRVRVRRAFGTALAAHPGVVVLTGEGEWVPWGPPLGVVTVEFGRSGPAGRADQWARALADHGARGGTGDVDAVAQRFRMTVGEIEDAALTALTAARLRDDAVPTRADLFAAAKAQGGHRLATLTERIEPAAAWAGLVLPAPATEQLRELCDRVAHRTQVHSDWGFHRVLSTGRGVSALFCGPPGTGKTMAAEVIAHELGLDLFKINLATIVSKYIGETEKNLEGVFSAATDTDAILLFDEADALFGKRSEVRDAHDRYANIEVSYLLQRMERYDGLAILATNLRDHLDDAFTRRLQFVIEFPVPDVAERRRIWEVCFPTEAPRDAGVDLDRLAAGFRLAGGNIRNIVLAAAFRAAAEGTSIGMAHLLAATGAEHRKMGRTLPPDALEPGGSGARVPGP